MNDRTMRDILTAFNSLINTKSIEKITVEKIAETAGVSKATFYRYFKDKYDVMNFNYKQLLDTAAAPANCHGYEELYEKLFTYGKMNWRFMQRAFDTFGANSFSDYIAKYSRDLVETITRQNRGNNPFTVAEELQLDLFCAGVSLMFRDWIAGKYKLTPKEAARALYELTPATLREYWYQS